MIRVAYLLTPVTFGGSEQVNVTFLKHVDRRRFEICPILLIRPWEAQNTFVSKAEELGYTSFRIPVALKPRSEGRDYFRVLRCLRDVGRLLGDKSFDVMHTHGYFADILGVPVSKMFHIPHVSTCHGFITTDRKLILYNQLDRFVLKFCDRIIAVSEGIEKELLEKGVKISRIAVIRNAVENSHQSDDLLEERRRRREALSIEAGECTIGYAGRLSQEKGVVHLIEGARILKENGERFKVLILGDGPKKAELERRAREVGLEKEIIFAGFRPEIERWLPALDIFVLPSLTEGTPMALLEAMSFGIPAVATRVGGVPEVVEDGVNGMLIRPCDSMDLSNKLRPLLHNPSLRDQMGKKGMEKVATQCNIRDWCRKIESQYELLLSKSK